jgi:hypothetical protein
LVHSYKEGTDIHAHIHWVTNGLEGTDAYVKWELTCTVANSNPATGIGSVFPAVTTLSVEQKIPANTPNRTNMYLDLGDIAGAGLMVEATMHWRIRRIASVGAAPAADPFATNVGFHIECDTAGSRSEVGK